MCFPENFQKIFKNTLFIKPPCATASRTTNTFFFYSLRKFYLIFCHLFHGEILENGDLNQSKENILLEEIVT